MSEAAAEARAAEERRLFEEAKEAQVRDLTCQLLTRMNPGHEARHIISRNLIRRTAGNVHGIGPECDWY